MTRLTRFMCLGMVMLATVVVYGQNRQGQRGATGQNATQGAKKDSFEVTNIKAVRPNVVRTIDALKKGDAAGAKAAFEDYDSAWNGIEMYINTRDQAMYGDLEHGYQDRITKALAADKPDIAATLADAQMMLVKFDEMIANEEKAAPLNPLFDDVARLRMVRAHLREVNPALKAGNLAKARKSFGEFNDQWDSIEDLIKERSQDSYTEIERNMIQIERGLGEAKPDVDAVSRLASEIMDKYNPVVNQIMQDARAKEKP